MIKRILIGALLMFAACEAYALDVVYPKQKTVTINSPSTFFIGSSDYSQPLYINDNIVEVHPSGGFAQTVPLAVGENNFTIKSGNSILNYKIIRPKQKSDVSVSEFKKYDTPKYIISKSNGMPLRTTPVDAGINRLAHLQSGVVMIADGEQDDFYRIKLGDDNYGWFAKSYAEINSKAQNDVFLTGANIDSDDEFYIYTFNLTSRVPWSVEENGDTLDISIYNVVNAPKDNFYRIKVPLDKILYGKDLIGYSAYYSGTDFIVKIRKPLNISEDKPLKDVKIAIDAGHGGSEFGATGCLGDYEKDINLKYAKDLYHSLKSRGADVIMIREKDEDVALKTRTEKANEEGAVIFISLHGNALPDYKDPLAIHGTEIYYYYKQAKPLAAAIMSAMITEAEVKNNGIIQQSFAVVRNTNALSILIEIGYLINPYDNAQIIDNEFRKKAVEAISDGLENYLRGQI